MLFWIKIPQHLMRFICAQWYTPNSNNMTSWSEICVIVIKQQPDNSSALNALGYTLADQNDRLEEATSLIEKAYALSPNDPAIIDSLGWLKYRMGDNKTALALLKKAYILFQDQEIAAHLGELLWVMGNKGEAKTIWKNGLKSTPDSRVIQETIERLVPSS